MRKFALLLTVGLLAAPAFSQEKKESPAKADPKPAQNEEKGVKPVVPTDKTKPSEELIVAATAKSPLDFKMPDIDGKDVALSKYKGKAVLIVNVASKCGLTKQYEQLEGLHEKYKDRGLAILAFPANNFNAQEPGTNAEIKEFCQTKFKVGFDLFSKVSVKGDDACELYKYLTTHTKDEKFHGDIEWNFAKFLVDREGNVIARFKPTIKPDDAAIVKAIEGALGDKQR